MTDHEADEAAINGLFQLGDDGWRTGDAELMASAYADDAQFYNITAQLLNGRAEIASHHDRLWKSTYSGVSAPEITGRVIRFVHQDVATISSRAVLKLPVGERHAHMLAVAVRGPEGWKLVALHNMVPFVPAAQL